MSLDLHSNRSLVCWADFTGGRGAFVSYQRGLQLLVNCPWFPIVPLQAGSTQHLCCIYRHGFHHILQMPESTTMSRAFFSTRILSQILNREIISKWVTILWLGTIYAPTPTQNDVLFNRMMDSELIPNLHLTTSFLELLQFPITLIWVLQKAEDKMKLGMKVAQRGSRGRWNLWVMI